MKINANLLRNGNIIRYQNKILQILNTNTIKPGKGGAFVQLEMRDLENGTKFNERLRTSENVEKLVTEEVNSTFLFLKDNMITLMNNETYEQFEVPLSLASDKTKLLEDGIQLVSEIVDGEIINIRFPKNILVTIEYADAVVKGQTASTSYKNAETSNGIKLLVPPHIKQGDKVIISSENFEYVEKAKK
ncbi:MAG: elongation factor P [Rickettsiales bacterium]|nr:elongation factor P [Rickettsiales bacterium]